MRLFVFYEIVVCGRDAGFGGSFEAVCGFAVGEDADDLGVGQFGVGRFGDFVDYGLEVAAVAGYEDCETDWCVHVVCLIFFFLGS